MSNKPEGIVTEATLKLWFPVEFAEEARTIEELTMRELSVDQTIELEKTESIKTPTDYDKSYFARMCGVPPAVIGMMKGRDFRRLRDLYNETLGNVEPPPQISES